jgi:hypothetical protein
MPELKRDSGPEPAAGGSRDRCQHTTADGRRCALSRAKHSALCLHHLRQQDSYPGASRVAAELLGSSKRLDSAIAINRVLGRLFVLVARNRIPPRHAATLAYIGQLLLQSLPLVRRERRLKEASSGWQQAFLQELLTRAAADPDASADTGPPVGSNYDGSQSALPGSESARRDGSEAARSSPAIETSVVYHHARNAWERP